MTSAAIPAGTTICPVYWVALEPARHRPIYPVAPPFARPPCIVLAYHFARAFVPSHAGYRQGGVVLEASAGILPPCGPIQARRPPIWNVPVSANVKTFETELKMMRAEVELAWWARTTYSPGGDAE